MIEDLCGQHNSIEKLVLVFRIDQQKVHPQKTKDIVKSIQRKLNAWILHKSVLLLGVRHLSFAVLFYGVFIVINQEW